MTFATTQQNEKRLFELLTDKFNSWKINHYYAPDTFNPWDVDIKMGNLTLLSEIKVRTFKHDKYPMAILEKNKVDKVLKTIKDNVHKYKYSNQNLAGAYFAFYSDGICLSWPLILFSHQGTEMLPKTTCGNQTYEKTKVYYYDIRLAKQFLM